MLATSGSAREGARVVIYDACPPPARLRGLRSWQERALRASWSAGAVAWRRWSTHTIAATSWRQALEDLEDIAHETPGGLDEAQFWGHGSEARALIGDDALTGAALIGYAGEHLREIGDVSSGMPRLWLRTCNTGGGRSGARWLELAARALGGHCAGHTRVIGFPAHPGLRCVRAIGREQPAWSLGVRSVPTWTTRLPDSVCR